MEAAPGASVTEEDLKAEAAALQRVHRALRGAENLHAGQLSPSQSDWQEPRATEALEIPESPASAGSFTCPVCGRGFGEGSSTGGGFMEDSQMLKAKLEVVEELLAKSRSKATEAVSLRRRLAATESRSAEMEAASCAVLRLCQELFAALELQNADFQRYVDATRRQTGPFLEEAAVLEAELVAVAAACNASQHSLKEAGVDRPQSPRSPVKLKEELQSERQKRARNDVQLEVLKAQLERACEDLEVSESMTKQLRDSLDISEAALAAVKAEAEGERNRSQGYAPQVDDKTFRAQRRLQRAQEGKEPSGQLAASAISALSQGMVVSKLCAGKARWQPRFIQLSPILPAIPHKLTWSKDLRPRVFGRRLSSVDFKDVTHVGLGADSLPEKLRHKEAAWRCFSVWTAQRSFFFKAEDDKAAEHLVVAISRLCHITQPVHIRSIVLHRAIGKLGPDPATRAARMIKALKDAASRQQQLEMAEKELRSSSSESSAEGTGDEAQEPMPG